jgi:hypothetical protein
MNDHPRIVEAGAVMAGINKSDAESIMRLAEAARRDSCLPSHPNTEVLDEPGRSTHQKPVFECAILAQGAMSNDRYAIGGARLSDRRDDLQWAGC